MDRRNFLNLGGAAIGTVLAGPMSLVQAASSPGVRKSVNGMTASDTELSLYSQAVRKMKSLPTTDQRNWQRQAQIHNDFCPHDNWWFLPWHRAYLHYFEEICRDVLNNKDFTLPYWDWTRLDTIPVPFLDQSSPLYDANRNRSVKLSSEIVGAPLIARIVGSNALVDLFSSPTTGDSQRDHVADGQLEGGPHNGVHGTIGGDMGAYMSPLDPIFWLHHCNVDRLWASWARVAGHSAPSADLWANHQLQSFYDVKTKQAVSQQTQNTVVAEDFGAIYDSYEQPSQKLKLASDLRNVGINSTRAFDGITASIHQLEAQASDLASVALGSGRNFQVRSTPNLSLILAKAAAPPIEPQPREAVAYLVIGDIPRPVQNSIALRVFLNCKDPSLATPLTDPTYVTTVAFFGTESHANVNFSINITETLGRMSREHLYTPDSPLDVALVPIDLSNPQRTGNQAAVKPGKIQVIGAETG